MLETLLWADDWGLYAREADVDAVKVAVQAVAHGLRA